MSTARMVKMAEFPVTNTGPRSLERTLQKLNDFVATERVAVINVETSVEMCTEVVDGSGGGILSVVGLRLFYWGKASGVAKARPKGRRKKGG